MITSGQVADHARLRRISVVDDDPSIREALKSLMRSVRFDVDTYGSAEEFLASADLDKTGCLILDVYLPGMNGFELQEQLRSADRKIPVVFITAHADEISRQRAMAAGAAEFLGKPVRREALFRAIESAIHSGNEDFHPTK
jgi:FixJ family two-component response regulator